jgi:hypothetical protein
VVSTDTSECSIDVNATPSKDGNAFLEMLFWFNQTPTSTMKSGDVISALKEECEEEWIALKYNEQVQLQVQPTVLFEETKEEVEAEEEVESSSVVELKLQVIEEEEQVLKTTHKGMNTKVLVLEVALLMAILLTAAYPYLKETSVGEYVSRNATMTLDMMASAPILEWFQKTYTQLVSSFHHKAMSVSFTTFERLEQMYPGSRDYLFRMLMHLHLDWIVVQPAPPNVKATHKIWRFLKVLLLPKNVRSPQAPPMANQEKVIKWVKSALAGPMSEDFESVQALFPKVAATGTTSTVVVSKPSPNIFRWIKTAFQTSK